VRQSAETLAGYGEQAAGVVTGALDLANRVQQALERQGRLIEAVARQAGERLDGFRQQVQDGAGDIEATAMRARATSDALAAGSAAIVESLRDIDGALQATQARLEQGMGAIRTQADGAVAELQGRAEALDGAAQRIGLAAGSAARDAAETETRLAAVNDSAALAAARAQAIRGAVAAQAEQLTDLGGRLTQQVAALEQTMTAQAASLRQAVETATASLEQVGGTLEGRQQRLQTAAAASLADLTRVAETLQRQSDDLAGVSDSVGGRVMALVAALGERAQGIAGAADVAEENLKRVAGSIRDQSTELAATAERTSSQVAHEADRLSGTVAGSEERLRSVTQSMAEGRMALEQASETTIRGMLTASRQLEERATDLSEASDRETTRLLGASVAVRQEAQSLQHTSERAAERVQAAGQDLVQRVASLSEAAEAAAARLEGTEQELRQARQTLSRETGDVVGGVEALRNTLDRHAASAATALADLRQATDALVGGFAAQAAALAEASRVAVEAQHKLDDDSASGRRRSFVALLPQITDRLHSHGVDITRAVEANVPEDAWQRYLAGDKSVFARRILRNRDRYSTDAIRHLYGHDPEFRQTVNRYLLQFEQLLEQAAQHDPEDLISAAFLSSDVGKVYLLLARGIGRLS
jgi:DNA anti-recombination protein RmuC